jgi:hypothetical protein
MKKIFYPFCLFTTLTIVLFACKKSPANISVGEYYGTYSHDTIIAGNCTTKVVEVNSLTVHFTITGDSLPETTLSNVEVNGGDEPYVLQYSGSEGSLTGSVTSEEMQWVWLGVDDTISFIGVKE